MLCMKLWFFWFFWFFCFEGLGISCWERKRLLGMSWIQFMIKRTGSVGRSVGEYVGFALDPRGNGHCFVRNIWKISIDELLALSDASAAVCVPSSDNNSLVRLY